MNSWTFSDTILCYAMLYFKIIYKVFEGSEKIKTPTVV